MYRDKSIQTATALFASYGIKAVDMKRIANEANVSEQSLYDEFADMEQLIEECIKQAIKEFQTAVNNAVSQANSSLERLMNILAVAFAELAAFCPVFYKDLTKHKLARKLLFSFREELRELCIGYFMDCEEEGFFASEINMDSIGSICFEELSTLDYQYQAKLLRMFLQNICTAKGNEELKRIDFEHKF